MAQAFGIVRFAGNNIRVGEMQNYRPVGAVSFLGRYRVIDFPISNMSNSEIEHIQVYVRRKPRSLTEHLGTGRHTISTQRVVVFIFFILILQMQNGVYTIMTWRHMKKIWSVLKL